MSVYTQLQRQQDIFQYVGAGFHDPKTDPKAIKIADSFLMHIGLVKTHIWPVIRPEAGIPRPLAERTTHAITTLAQCGDIIYPQLHVFVTQEPSLEGPLNHSEAVLRVFHQTKAPEPQRRSKGKQALSPRPQREPHQAASSRGIDPDEVSYNLLAFRVDYSDHGQGKDHTNPHIHVLRFSPTLDARGDTIIKIDTPQPKSFSKR
jgi:hypothetical protein